MLDENRRPFAIAVVALAVVLIVIGGVVLFRGGGSQTTLSVTSIPNDLTLTLDGHEIPANGDVEIKAGEHTLVGTRRGFQSYTQKFTSGNDPLSVKMYLYANSAEGREWTKNNPEQEQELEAEAGRNFSQTQNRLQMKYPILAQLPYIGPGFQATYTKSKTDPNNPEAISVVIEVFAPNGKKEALRWLRGYGWDPETLDIIWTTGK
ncbi:S-layer protein [Kribbella sp. HUAS MG21]|uniref:S-layer protein n=1 Tax=Kribbella sp. HUAS MG21 TaxID=3160966 RepID=A0AAU7TKQ7_9ACTN